jgi:hypothetical protein
MVSLRPTRSQALCRGVGQGARVGSVCSVAVSAVLALASGTPGWNLAYWPVAGGVVAGGVVAGGGVGWGLMGLVAVAVPVPALAVFGAVAGVLLGRDRGADVDEDGVREVPASPATFTPWRRVEDVRMERRNGRVRVALFMDSGEVVRLNAPYNGRWLAADRHFEQKVFLLRNMWEDRRPSPAPTANAWHGRVGQWPVRRPRPKWRSRATPSG